MRTFNLLGSFGKQEMKRSWRRQNSTLNIGRIENIIRTSEKQRPEGSEMSVTVSQTRFLFPDDVFQGHFQLRAVGGQSHLTTGAQRSDQTGVQDEQFDGFLG